MATVPVQDHLPVGEQPRHPGQFPVAVPTTYYRAASGLTRGNPE